ncbi:MAG: GTPase ObgE [Chlamydiales bacterium]|jgi:GTP-binding protein|nr:GTPase ObgE [Chlamydiales bacterium]
MFIDSVTVTLRAGKGGNGVVAWRREKFIPKGGPVGGNGGRGGSIILKTNENIFSLEGFRNRRLINAENGIPGGRNLQKGRNGKNLILHIPCGTIVKNTKTQEILVDFTEKNQEHVLCKGGRGGKGNACFKSSTNQAPNIYTPGLEGETQEVQLELKLIADVGLIGMPNAGKSTLLKQITHCHVKIGAYPFTTLRPNLSHIQFEDFSRILIADVPGIIEGAHFDRGLGLSFLKHIERSSVLVYLIDISGMEGRDPFKDFQILQKELIAYRKELLDKPFLVVLNKMDCETAIQNLEAFKQRYPYPKTTLFPISAMRKESIKPLLKAMQQLVPPKF